MNDTKDSLPEMLDPTDVCSAMDDLAFMEYCYSHFDVNHDHKVGLHEARAVREIDLSDSKVVSLRGIEYFINLERLILDRSTVRGLHLLQNTKLKEISAKGCVHLLHTELPNDLSAIPNNEIWYTSTNGKVVTPYTYTADAFGANIISNTYENDKGIITFDGDVTSIGLRAFSVCTSLASITIPDSVISIEYQAFAGCSSLAEFKGKFASEDGRCLIVNGTLDSFAPAGLTEYTIPEGIISIGMEVFYDCENLASITIPQGVTSIRQGAFSGCSSLESVNIPDSVTSIGNSAFYGCDNLPVVDNIIYADTYAVEAVDKIQTSYTLKKNTRFIGSSAFSDCTSLASITIPNGVTSIGYQAFYRCYSLTSVTIGNGVTSIEGGAFYGCSSLTSITIPDSVTSIEGRAFSGCESLKEIYCQPTTPPECIWEMFVHDVEGRKIYVPRQSVEAYKSAQRWKEYADDIVGYDFEE